MARGKVGAVSGEGFRKSAAFLLVLAALTLCCLPAVAGCAIGGSASSSDDSAATAETESSDPSDGEGQSPASSGAGSSAQSKAGSSSEKPDESTLYALLDRAVAEQLIDLAETDADAAWIAAHPDAYKPYGNEVQMKLLKLVANDPDAAPFVRKFPDSYPADAPDYDAPALDAGSPSSDVPETPIPHLYQWDQRWGYVPYSGCCIATSGCGPTSLAMVYQGLTGKNDITPYDMAQLAYQSGYVTESDGTMNELFLGLCDYLGIMGWDVSIQAEDVIWTLQKGFPIIANVGPGRFSASGHFFVLSGLTEDGKVILNDPFSITRSSQLWDLEVILSETIAMYAYALPQ